MKKIDLIIDALEDMCGGICNAEYNPCQARVALTAARELRELKPVAWAVKRRVATCNEEYAELWRSNREEVTPLYALDEVKHD